MIFRNPISQQLTEENHLSVPKPINHIKIIRPGMKRDCLWQKSPQYIMQEQTDVDAAIKAKLVQTEFYVQKSIYRLDKRKSNRL